MYKSMSIAALDIPFLCACVVPLGKCLEATITSIDLHYVEDVHTVDELLLLLLAFVLLLLVGKPELYTVHKCERQKKNKLNRENTEDQQLHLYMVPTDAVTANATINTTATYSTFILISSFPLNHVQIHLRCQEI
uniref:Uncharacterized protein n=1 Tax=Glossina brevipalpis TaxID=37001 RepID=A0A1A9WZM2_9MUSC